MTDRRQRGRTCNDWIVCEMEGGQSYRRRIGIRYSGMIGLPGKSVIPEWAWGPRQVLDFIPDQMAPLGQGNTRTHREYPGSPNIYPVPAAIPVWPGNQIHPAPLSLVLLGIGTTRPCATIPSPTSPSPAGGGRESSSSWTIAASLACLGIDICPIHGRAVLLLHWQHWWCLRQHPMSRSAIRSSMGPRHGSDQFL